MGFPSAEMSRTGLGCRPGGKILGFDPQPRAGALSDCDRDRGRKSRRDQARDQLAGTGPLARNPATRHDKCSGLTMERVERRLVRYENTLLDVAGRASAFQADQKLQLAHGGTVRAAYCMYGLRIWSRIKWRAKHRGHQSGSRDAEALRGRPAPEFVRVAAEALTPAKIQRTVD